MFTYDNTEISYEKTAKGEYKNEKASEIESGIEEIKKKYGFPVIIKWSKKYGLPDPKYPMVKKGGLTIPTTAQVTENGIKHTWTYYETWKVDSGHNKQYSLKSGETKFMFNGFLALNEDQGELAWFLCTKSHLRYDEKTNINGYFVIDNPALEAKQTTQGLRQTNQMTTWIFDDLNDTDLRIVAQSYDISISLMTTEMIQLALLEKAKTIGYDKFSKNRTVNAITELKAKIKTAIDSNIIGFDTEQDPTAYFMLDGKLDRKIRKLGKNQNKIEVLFDHFSTNEDDKSELLKLIE